MPASSWSTAPPPCTRWARPPWPSPTAADGRPLKLQLPEDRAAVELLHDDLVPALPRGPQRIEYHHSVEATLNRLRKDSVAVLMPAPDVDLVLKIAADDRLLPEKATSFQPKPSVGVLIRSLRDE